MLEDVFADPATIRRLRCCVLGAHLGEFCSHLERLGYEPATVRGKLSVLGSLARWMERGRLAVEDLDERRTVQFVRAWRRRGRTYAGVDATLRQFVATLRCAGVVDTPPQPQPEGSLAVVLLCQFEEHLRHERALAPSTVATYRSLVAALACQRLTDGLAGAGRLDAHVVRDFLLARTSRMAPRYAQLAASAVRSFLRFLFLRGATPRDLSCAVPMVRQWRLAGVPRYVADEDVRRLLAGCDRTSATGRRDYAILLLLARLGLRASEVLALDLGDLRWREGEIVIRGKGQVHDRLPLLADVGSAIAAYLREDRPSGPSRRVFLCRKAPHRGFSNPSSVSTIVERAFVRAGLPARGAHTLRHSLATTMLRRGASMQEIGQVLRHRAATTTEIYAKLDFGALREVALPWPVARGAR